MPYLLGLLIVGGLGYLCSVTVVIPWILGGMRRTQGGVLIMIIALLGAAVVFGLGGK